MYTKQQLNEVKQGVASPSQAKLHGTHKSNQPKADLRRLASDIDKVIRKPLIKVDKGGRLSIRDKAIRKIMPKAMHLIGSHKEKDMLLNRLMDMIHKAQKMGKDKADNLVAQLWIVYASIEAKHVEDDHWQLTNIPQPWAEPKDGAIALRFGDIVYLLERELCEVAATDWVSKTGDSTRGYQFTGGIIDGSMTADNLDGFWSRAEQRDRDRLQTLNCSQTSDEPMRLPVFENTFVGPLQPKDRTPCRVDIQRPKVDKWEGIKPGSSRGDDMVQLISRQPYETPVSLPAPKPIEKPFGYGLGDINPMAKPVHDTPEDRADNLAWLASKR